MENGAVAHTNTDVDINILTRIIKYNHGKTLVLTGRDSKGKKIQEWINGAVDWELHLKGIKKQGARLDNNGVANTIVVDVDKAVDAKEFCKEAYKIDNKIIPFKSPSGRWHAYKILHEEIPTKELAKEAKRIERAFSKIYGDAVDRAKTQPIEGGWTGINLPFCTPEQYPYSPQGNKLNFKQFKFRWQFQEHPILAIAAGLQEPGRHDSLIIMAAYMFKNNMMQHLDDVVAAFGTDWTDDGYLDRINHKKIHEKYDVSEKALNKTISNILGEDYQLPADDADVTTELEIFEHTGCEKIQRRPWLIHGWLLEQALTLVVGQPGVGKTMFMHMMAYGLATGNPIFGKEILHRGNVLIIAAEETMNEIDFRLSACKQKMGKNDNKFKIYKRGLENDLKLVKFTKDAAVKTKQYKQLENVIKSKNIKFVLLDPLINFQSGNYDENSNQNMDAYVKQFLIPIAVKMGGAVIAGHHTNKLSMVSTQDNELLVDNQNALMAARGASALIGAARFVLAFQPMTKKLWEQHFKEHITDGSNFVHYAGLIEAKSNYNMIADDISWLKKESVDVATDDGFTESTGFFATTELNKVTKAKNRLKAAQNLQWCKAQMPTVQKLMGDEDEITLNSVVVELLTKDPDHADGNISEATIKTRIRRKLENGFSGKEERKDGFQSEGIECDDGYNYWLKTDHGKSGAAKKFITRAIDFKRRNAAR